MLETVIAVGVVLVAAALALALLLYLLVPRTDPRLAELDRMRERPADVVAAEIADPVEAAREARALLKQGKKIEAIKVYREKTGVRLAEAKAAVERL